MVSAFHGGPAPPTFSFILYCVANLVPRFIPCSLHVVAYIEGVGAAYTERN